MRFFLAALALVAVPLLSGCDSMESDGPGSFADVNVLSISGPSTVISGSTYTFTATVPSGIACAYNDTTEEEVCPYNLQIDLEPLPTGTTITKTGPRTFSVRYRTRGAVPQHDACIYDAGDPLGAIACMTVN